MKDSKYFKRDRITQQTGLEERLNTLVEGEFSLTQRDRWPTQFRVIGVTVHYLQFGRRKGGKSG